MWTLCRNVSGIFGDVPYSTSLLSDDTMWLCQTPIHAPSDGQLTKKIN